MTPEDLSAELARTYPQLKNLPDDSPFAMAAIHRVLKRRSEERECQTRS